MANGAPLGVFEYKYGLRVSVIALRSPPQWLTPKGLEVGGPRAFGYVSFRFRLGIFNGGVWADLRGAVSIWIMRA
jgi:DUF917 family protein